MSDVNQTSGEPEELSEGESVQAVKGSDRLAAPSGKPLFEQALEALSKRRVNLYGINGNEKVKCVDIVRAEIERLQANQRHVCPQGKGFRDHAPFCSNCGGAV